MTTLEGKEDEVADASRSKTSSFFISIENYFAQSALVFFCIPIITRANNAHPHEPPPYRE